MNGVTQLNADIIIYGIESSINKKNHFENPKTVTVTNVESVN